MKSLTVIHPFAHLIAAGVKRVENRGWPTRYRGPLAIHAGKAKTYGGERVTDLAREDGINPANLAFGAVVAVADLVDCVELIPRGVDRDVTPEWARKKYPWLDDHESREGPVCWVLLRVRRLAEPIPAKGEQGLWDWTPPADLAFADTLDAPLGCCALAVAVLKGVPGIGPNGTAYESYGKRPDEVAADLRRELTRGRQAVAEDVRRRMWRAMPDHYPSTLAGFAAWAGVSVGDVDPDTDGAHVMVSAGDITPVDAMLFDRGEVARG